MFSGKAKWLWLDGQLVPWEDGTIHLSSHALHYGSGVFEGIRCYETDRGPAVFRLDDHINRLKMSANAYGLKLDYSTDQLRNAVEQVVAMNGFASCYIRPLVFYGSDVLTIHPKSCPTHAAILTWLWEKPLGSDQQEQGLKVKISHWVKVHSSMIPTGVKASGQYLNSILAIRDAAESGCDEAILLDINGNIAEGSAENLFLVSNRCVVTNDLEDSILPGVTRDTVLSIAHDLGFETAVRRIKPGDLFDADEAFFSGTGVEITPIREVLGERTWKPVPGPVTRSIQDAFNALVRGRSGQHSNWLHWVADSVPACKQEISLEGALR